MPKPMLGTATISWAAPVAVGLYCTHRTDAHCHGPPQQQPALLYNSSPQHSHRSCIKSVGGQDVLLRLYLMPQLLYAYLYNFLCTCAQATTRTGSTRALNIDLPPVIELLHQQMLTGSRQPLLRCTALSFSAPSISVPHFGSTSTPTVLSPKDRHSSNCSTEMSTWCNRTHTIFAKRRRPQLLHTAARVPMHRYVL